ncbi:MAG: flagellar motor protein MotB [Thermogemmata sp.]|nr:flagellar motor protein MotB [Thermogemmata sp.]
MAAGKAGGSWKVAYADFVTAMMAFFLVMWIGAQDEKVRQSVANYFIDPSGVSKHAVQSGAAMTIPTYGSIPEEKTLQMDQGRHQYTPHDQMSPATKAIIVWIQGDEKRYRYWKTQAQKAREAVAQAQVRTETPKSPEELAIQHLAQQLRAELTGDIPPETPEVYKNLVLHSFHEVNWTQIAEDLLRA